MLDPQSTEQVPAVDTRHWQAAVAGGVVLWVGIRAVVSVISLLAVRFGAGPAALDGDDRPGGFFGLLHHWDSSYFLGVAAQGYFPPIPAPESAAFFPGYPLAARGFTQLITMGSPTDASLVMSLSLVSAASSVMAGIVLWRLVDLTQPAGIAPLGTLMFLAGPYAVFLYANYSESLFLAFAVAGWYCAVRQRWWLVGLWCALATATRINGCFLLAALVVMYVLQRRRAGRRLWAPLSAWVLLGVTGVVGFFGYLAAHTGDPLTWNTAQAQVWSRSLTWPWQAFVQTAGRVLFASTVDRRLQFALDIVFAALIVIAILAWIRRRDWPPVVYAGLTLITLTTSFTFVSLARNSLTLFPLPILVAVVVHQARSRWIGPAVIGCWTGLFLINTTLFALGYWTD